LFRLQELQILQALREGWRKVWRLQVVIKPARKPMMAMIKAEDKELAN
jgi:hypothetical protein